MKLNYSALLWIFLVLVSCEYEPSGEYAPDIKEPQSIPPLEIDLNVESDTIIIIVDGTLNFNFQTADRNLHWIKFCIGDNCKIYNSKTGSFKMSIHENVTRGTHYLTIEVYTGSGSGSIADVLGAEGFLYSKTWTLIVYERLIYQTTILSVEPDNGSLKLTWNKFRYPVFEEYRVYKTPHGALGELVAIIEDQDITSVYDTTYVGGKTEYRVDVKTIRGYSTGLIMTYRNKLSKGYVKEVKNNLLTLTWDRSEYFNNIKGYEIYAEFDNFGYELKAQISNGSDTSYVLDRLRFLYDNKIILMPVPKKMPFYSGHPRDYLGSTTTVGYIGDKFNAGTIVTPMGDYLYYKKANFIYEYNYIKEELTDSIELSTSKVSFAVSPNGKHILAVDDKTSVILYNTGSKEINNYSLEQLSDYVGDFGFPSISDNGIGVIHLYDNGELINTLVYDFINGKKIFQDKIIHWAPYNISADGKYFAGGNRIYEIHSDTVVEASEIMNEIWGSDFLGFNMNDPDLFVHIRENYLIMKKISDLSTISECFIPAWHIFNIDYNTNQILITNEEKFYVYDIISCEELYNYPTSYSEINFYSVRYCNKTIYDSYLGLKLKLD